jgi:hypothetical protein
MIGDICNDHKVKVDGADTTPDFLVPKIVAGAGIALGVLNPGGNEQLQITAAGAPPTFETVNTISTGNLGGTTLVGVDATAFPDGSLVTVFSVGASFQLVKTPSAALIAAIDGITVVQSTFNPAWVWARLVTSNVVERFSANPPVFIDPAAGNDDNDGLTAPTALRSAPEWSRRMNGAILTGLNTLGLGVGAVGVFGPMQLRSVSGGKLRTFGAAPTQSIAGTISVVLVDNPATGVENGFTAVGGPVLVDGVRLKITASGTGSHVGAVSYIKGFQGGDVTKPITKTWMAPTSLDPAIPGTEIIPSAGDTFVVETLVSSIQGWMVDWYGMGGGAGVGYPYFQDVLMAQDSELGAWRFRSNEKPTEADGHVLYQLCTFSPRGPNDDFSGGLSWFRNCDFKKGVILGEPDTGFYGLDSNILRGRLTTDECGYEIVNSNCVDGAVAIALSAGPGAIFASASSLGGGACSFCFSRCTGNAIDIGPSGELLGGTMVCWTPPIGARNALVNGLHLSGNAFASDATGGGLVANLRVTGAQVQLGTNTIAWETWDVVHGCGYVAEI